MTKLDKLECLEWAFGNLMDNATRGKVAEFVVAKALDVATGQRTEWDYADLHFGEMAIEVKSSGYLQSWQQSAPSRIVFDIAPRSEKWDPKTNIVSKLPEPRRLADAYVFCVFEEQDPSKANPLDTDQWQFYVASTRKLDDHLGSQKSAALSTVQGVSETTSFIGVRAAIESISRN
jgi:hypothetical protein